jgi:CDP-diacylglycerol--glycerol-3-phosphate 3-phosphatidyltransferase
MVFLTLALSPLVSPAVVFAVAPAALAPSLAVFLRDYLVVAGHLSRGSALCRY